MLLVLLVLSVLSSFILEINAKWFLGCFWSPTCKFKDERKLDFKSQIWNVILLRIKCLDQTAKINELFTELAFPLQLYSYSPLWVIICDKRFPFENWHVIKIGICFSAFVYLWIKETTSYNVCH